MTKAEMDAGAERDMPVRPPLEIELLGMRVGVRIEVRGRQHRHDLVALLQTHAAEFDVPADVARLGELHWRYEAQKFLDRETGSAPVLFEPVAQARIAHELVHGSADQMRRRLMHELVARDASALLLGAYELGDEPLAALTARRLEPLLQIAFHGEDSWECAQEPERAGEAREAARPGGELRPAGQRQSQSRADHGQRTPWCIARDQCGRASVGEE